MSYVMTAVHEVISAARKPISGKKPTINFDLIKKRGIILIHEILTHLEINFRL